MLTSKRKCKPVNTWLCCFGLGRRVKLADDAKQEPDEKDELKLAEKENNGRVKWNYLLPPLSPLLFGRNSLVIDLDETLIHSSVEPVSDADFVVNVDAEGCTHEVFVLKRPFVDLFLSRVGDLFECILFTASLSKYAVPVADKLDKAGVFKQRLFREACVFRDGIYIKDLSMLGRSLSKLAIVDNSPSCYSLHPHNAIPVHSWFDDPNDKELLDLLPFIEKIAFADDIRLLISHEQLEV